MRTKWLLIALPLAILALLLQSSLWVPTYASQAKGNPGRLVTFLRASIGYPKAVSYVFALTEQTSMESYINAGVDGIIPIDAHQDDLLAVPQ